MKAAKTLLINTLLLSGTSLLMRGIGVFFQLYVADLLGAAGVGLLQLVLSVYSFAVTVAASGIKLTATRVIAEELGRGGAGVRPAVRRCLVFAVGTGLFSAVALYVGAPFFALRWLDDTNAVFSLRILAWTLPMIAVDGVAAGYFTAMQRLAKPAGIQFAAQLVRIAVTAALLYRGEDVAMACGAVAFGALAGEASELAAVALLYKRDIATLPKQRDPGGLAGRVLRISAPVALSLYLRMALSTAENILTPKGLKASGIAAQQAVSTYGIIEGMVFPVLLFPCAFITVLAELMIPELTESQVLGHHRRINYMIGRIFRFGVPFTVWAFGMMCIFSGEIGAAVFSTPEAAYYLRILSPMVLLMYLDALADGMLKGLGKYVATLRYSIIDSLLGVALVIVLLPRMGVAGYLLTTMATKAVNCALSMNHLCRVTAWPAPFAELLRALGCCALAAFGTEALFSLSGIAFGTPAGKAAALVLAATAVYAVLLRLSRTISGADLRWLRAVARD